MGRAGLRNQTFPQWHRQCERLRLTWWNKSRFVHYHELTLLHNIGQGTQEEDVLFKFRIIGHYRVKQGG